MCGRVHSSARRWHVAWSADAFLCRARTHARGRLIRRFRKVALAERFARKSQIVSQLPYQTRDRASDASSHSCVVQRVIRTA
jgi:hypothetical protein